LADELICWCSADHGEKLRVIAEVLRIERNPSHPQAALQVLGRNKRVARPGLGEAGIKMAEAGRKL